MSATSQHQLSVEKRLAALEQRVENLTAQHANGSTTKDWRRTVGMFEGDEFSRAVDAEALAIREADRRAGREGEAE